MVLDDELRRGLRQARFIVGALLGGVLIFGLVVVWLVGRGDFGSDPPLGRLMLGAWLVIAAGQLAAERIVARHMVAEGRRAASGIEPGEPLDVGAALPAFTRLTILRGALVEGSSLFAVATYLITGERLALVAVACGVVVLVALMRVEPAFERFVERVGEPV